MRSELKETIQYGMNIVTTHTFRIGWDDRLQRSDRDWDRSRNDAVQRGVSGDS
jgi:hypothetical protein